MSTTRKPIKSQNPIAKKDNPNKDPHLNDHCLIRT